MGIPTDGDRILVVDGERFRVRLRDGDRRRWVYDCDWLSGPNPGYGFSVSSGAAMDEVTLREGVAGFLAGIDPATGYLSEG